MDRATKRKIRRFLYKSRVPAAYVVLLLGGLFLFLFGLRSCYESDTNEQHRNTEFTTQVR